MPAFYHTTAPSKLKDRHDRRSESRCYSAKWSQWLQFYHTIAPSKLKDRHDRRSKNHDCYSASRSDSTKQSGRNGYSFTTLQLPVNRKIDMTEDLRVTTVTVQEGLLLRQHAAWAQ
ncbi:hypothetical protein J6590_051866 [Homalodisca vitripennis]|nr:hypothetical protein J6590_051866 [Homalodisca vitripennis]